MLFRSTVDGISLKQTHWSEETAWNPFAYTYVGVALTPSMFAIGWFMKARVAFLVNLGTIVGWFFLVPLAVFPALVDEAGEFLGVNYAPALLFSFSSLLLLGIVIHYSWELSRLESRTRRLGEEIALLNERLNDAERADDGEDES